MTTNGHHHHTNGQLNGNRHVETKYGENNVEWVTRTTKEGAVLTQLKHQGPSGHSTIPAGGQCHCGWYNLGNGPSTL